MFRMFPRMCLQEQYWRSVLFHNHFGFLSASGYETDEESQRKQEKEQQELLMKMFAVSSLPVIAHVVAAKRKTI